MSETPTDRYALDVSWQRLDRRMVLVHPVREVGRFLPALIALAVAGTASGQVWQYLGIAVPIVLGVARYLTTRYRIAGGRVELRRGLLSRHVVSTPIERVRTVDIVSSPVHRVLGVTTLRIGTGEGGGDGDRLDLDGLRIDHARRLRGDLLRVAPAAPTSPAADVGAGPATPFDPTAPPPPPPAPPPPPPPPLAVFDARWLRFAPLTATGLVVVAALAGVLGQFADSLGLWRDVDDAAVAAPALALVAVLLVGLLVAVVGISVLGFWLVNGGYRLTRDHRSWQVTRGLLTTRETSLDVDRVAGVALGEPLALRLARGRHLQAIVTGARAADNGDGGSSLLVPPSDADIAPRVAAAVLGVAEPVTAPLTSHGPAAARRRWLRALVPTLPVVGAAVLAVVLGAPWWILLPPVLLVVAAAVVALDRVAGLGHTVSAGHLVARSGSLARRREILDTRHVIAVTLRDSWFQRRQGLVTLVAATAGGQGRVTVLDVPRDDAVELADALLPPHLTPFRSPVPTP